MITIADDKIFNRMNDVFRGMPNVEDAQYNDISDFFSSDKMPKLKKMDRLKNVLTLNGHKNNVHENKALLSFVNEKDLQLAKSLDKKWARDYQEYEKFISKYDPDNKDPDHDKKWFETPVGKRMLDTNDKKMDLYRKMRKDTWCNYHKDRTGNYPKFYHYSPEVGKLVQTASEELDSMYKQALMGGVGDSVMLGATIGDLTKKYNKAAGGMTGVARQKAGWGAVAGGIGKSVAKGAILGAGAQVAANAIDNITKPTQEDEYGRRVQASEVLDEMWKEAKNAFNRFMDHVEDIERRTNTTAVLPRLQQAWDKATQDEKAVKSYYDVARGPIGFNKKILPASVRERKGLIAMLGFTPYTGNTGKPIQSKKITSNNPQLASVKFE